MVTRIIKTSHANNTVWVPLTHEIGKGGTLNGIGVAGGPYHHYFHIRLDGIDIVQDFLCAALTDYQNNGIALNLPFDNELEVRIKDEPHPTSLTRFWAAYTVSSSERVKYEMQENVKFGDTTYVYERETYRAKDGKEFTVQSLKGSQFIAEVIPDRDTFLPQENITGKVRLINYRGNPERKDVVEVVIRPLGFMRIIGKPYILRNVVGEAHFKIPNPDLKGRFEVVTTIPGWANEPGVILLL